jgi:transposase
VAYLHITKIRGTEYIYGGICHRNHDNGRPERHSICLGKVDRNTRKPIYNDKYITWMTNNGSSLTKSLSDYAKEKNIVLNIEDTDIHDLQINPNNIINYNNDISKMSNNIDNINNELRSISIHELESSNVKIYGSTYLLKFLSEKIGLSNILKSAFPDYWTQLLTLTYFYIVEPNPLMYCKYFSETYDTNSLPSSVSSQRISEIFSDIDESSKNIFYRYWSTFIQESDYIALDTTSISTYSHGIDKAEYGKPKQDIRNKKLKQINLCLLFGQSTGLPVYSTSYFGSINDVSLLVNAVQKYSFIHDNNFNLVLDRGFYSKKNLNYMLNSVPKIKFIVGLTATTSLKNELIEENKDIFMNIKYAINTSNETLYGTSKRILWNNKYLYAHIFINPNQYIDKHNQVVNDFIDLHNEASLNPEKYSDDPEFTKFLSFKKAPNSPKAVNGYIITRKQKAFDDAISKAGWFIFLSNEIHDPEEALKIYHKRDIVEKAYDIVKNSIDHDRPRVHSDINYDNKYFIGFLALIFLSYIHHKMLENDLYKSYTIKEIVKILNGITIIKTDNINIISTLTAKQKYILDIFNCPYPV